MAIILWSASVERSHMGMFPSKSLNTGHQMEAVGTQTGFSTLSSGWVVWLERTVFYHRYCRQCSCNTRYYKETKGKPSLLDPIIFK